MSEQLRTRVITAVVLGLIVVGPLLAGGIWVTAILLGALALTTGYEIAKLVDPNRRYIGAILNAIAIVTLYNAPGEYFMVVSGIWLILLFIIEQFGKNHSANLVVYPYAMTFIMALMCRSAVVIYAQFLESWYTPFLIVMYLFIACFGCDTGAYFIGSKFGKHKMLPEVSPHKTWEGSIGGYAVGAILSMIYGLLVCKMFPQWFIVLASLLLPIVSQIGDLAFSSIKREFSIKDYSHLLPGHGGILDRIDSLSFVFMLFYVLMLGAGII